ncbi:molybdopterin cofactor-binding domain-containing protein [Altererythrobacter sp.]|uniref:xanthine dehydrogenase family protein molybdopterin-binding subunit n=1 Tax=Altererythrobacter sp. TaxID=1872480 RepID=UPI003D0F1B6F
MPLTRRGLLTGAAIGGGVVVAWALFPRSYPDVLEPGRGEYAFDAWLKIAEDGVVTVAVPQLEMGQGITTVLPQVVAAELGADWRQIAVEPAPVSGSYANVPLAARWAPLWMPFAAGLAEEPDGLVAQRFAEGRRFSATADGMSLAAFEGPCRNAAAAARAMLAQAAADRWNVSWEECEAQAGFIVHGDKRLRFAELAQEASTYDPPDPPPLRSEPHGEDPLPGQIEGAGDYPRLDLPSKVDGSFMFAGDVRLPGMVFAAIRHGPVDKATLVEFNQFSTQGIRGIVGAVKGNRWLAVAATNWWAAERALDTMKARFNVEFLADSDDFEARIDDALRKGEAHRIEERGGGYDSGGNASLALRYDVEPGVHAPLETASATARFEGGRLELWVATQAPESARIAAARALGIAVEDVVLYPMPAGGSFDSRLEHDHVIEVAMIARELGRPVQLTWSRWQELLRSRPRQPASLLVTAQIGKDGQGRIEGLKTRIATPPANMEFGQRLFDNKASWAAIRDSEGAADALACEGAMPVYDIPRVAVDHVPVEIGLPCSRMRGNAHGYTAFAIESFIDEVATRHGREPLSFRISMLGQDVRLAACLQRVARLAEWDGGQDQSGKGIACHRIGDAETGGRIACIASARAGDGGVRVTRLSAIVDIGRIVNLDIARQQIEGGLVFGLAMAMGASARYRSGLPVAQRLSDLNLPALTDCPEIEVEFMASEAPPADPGELGAVVAAPAIANALYSATGLRLRRLPLLSGGL